MMTLTKSRVDERMRQLDGTYHTSGAVSDFLILQLS